MDPIGEPVKKKPKRSARFSKFFKVGDRVRHLDKNWVGTVTDLDNRISEPGLPPKVFVKWDHEDEAQKKRKQQRVFSRASGTADLELVTQEEVVDEVWAKCELTQEQRDEFLSNPITRLKYEPEQAAEAAQKLAELGLGDPRSPKWRTNNKTFRPVVKRYVVCARLLGFPHMTDDTRAITGVLVRRGQEGLWTMYTTYQCKCGIPPVSARINIKDEDKDKVHISIRRARFGFEKTQECHAHTRASFTISPGCATRDNRARMAFYRVPGYCARFFRS
jgi:hypothetical protein